MYYDRYIYLCVPFFATNRYFRYDKNDSKGIPQSELYGTQNVYTYIRNPQQTKDF